MLGFFQMNSDSKKVLKNIFEMHMIFCRTGVLFFPDRIRVEWEGYWTKSGKLASQSHSIICKMRGVMKFGDTSDALQLEQLNDL